jgi:iron(III) transport system permease protein
MFTSSALRNMDPSPKRPPNWRQRLRHVVLGNVPADHAGDVSSMLLSFIVMPASTASSCAGCVDQYQRADDVYFQATNWSPPLYNGCRGRDHPDGVTGALVFLQQKVLSGRIYHGGRQGLPSAQSRSRALALVHVWPRHGLFGGGGDPAESALIVAAFRKFMFIHDAASLFDMRQYSLVHFEHF